MQNLHLALDLLEDLPRHIQFPIEEIIVVPGIVIYQSELESDIDGLADRPVTQLDPIEKAILLLGFYELKSVTDVPYKVVINESVNLARRFGAVDGHKYINALLDRAVREYRPEA